MTHPNDTSLKMKDFWYGRDIAPHASIHTATGRRRAVDPQLPIPEVSLSPQQSCQVRRVKDSACLLVCEVCTVHLSYAMLSTDSEVLNSHWV